MEEANYVMSNKNKPILVDKQGFHYKKEREVADRKYWICRMSGCSVTAVTVHPENSSSAMCET